MTTPSHTRSARTQGPRTTLRIPANLARLADAIAKSEGATRNEALVHLALLGAQQRSRLEATAALALAKRRTEGIRQRRLSAIPAAEGFPSDEDLTKLIEFRGEYYLAR